ncbi:MAG: error-prone DNA polymerase, partial [Chloroflexota bacterium]|nr:error-prone DNA polymerase [Chloroflexota bacterium]
VDLPPMSAWDQMATDYETLGLSPRYHPLGLLRSHLPADLVTTADLAHRGDGLTVRIAGLIVCRQRPGTAKGITFLLLEDEHGLINVIVYPDLYDRERLLVRGEPFLTIEGKVQHRGGTLNLLAQRLWPLDRSRAADASLASQDPGTPDTAPAPGPGALSPATHDYR